MIEKSRNAINDCEAQAQPAFRTLGALAEALEFVEYDSLILGRDADTGVDDLDGDVVAAPPAT